MVTSAFEKARSATFCTCRIEIGVLHNGAENLQRIESRCYKAYTHDWQAGNFRLLNLSLQCASERKYCSQKGSASMGPTKSVNWTHLIASAKVIGDC